MLPKLKTPAERLWYAQAALRHGWSPRLSTVQVETQAHRRMSEEQQRHVRENMAEEELVIFDLAQPMGEVGLASPLRAAQACG